MKLAFFLAAFFLIFLRVYFGSWWPGHGDRNSVTITIGNGDDYEKIRYSGKIILTDDESGITSIAPDGYLRYRRNDKRLAAESDLQGNIKYDIRDGDRSLSVEEKDGKAILKEALSEIIAYGFEARERMLRIYARGGDSALLREMDHFKGGGFPDMYMRFLVSHDTLSKGIVAALVDRTMRQMSGRDQVTMLKRLMDIKNLTEAEWSLILHASGRMIPEPDKRRLLLHAAPIMPRTPLLISTYKDIVYSFINKNDGDTLLKAIQ